MKKLLLICLATIASGAILLTSCDKGEEQGELKVNAPSEIVFEADGTSEHSTVSVSGRDDWQLVLDPADGNGWLTVTSKGNGSFTLAAAPNTRPNPPADVKLTVSAPGATSVEITAKQRAAGEGLTVTPNLTTLLFMADGTTTLPGSDTPVEEAVFSVATNLSGWNIAMTPADGAGWLSVDKNGTENTFTLTALVNNELTPPAEVTVTVTGEGGSVSHSITVNQEARKADAPYTNISLQGVANGTEVIVTFANNVRRKGSVTDGKIAVPGLTGSVKTIYSIAVSGGDEILVGREQDENVVLAFDGGKLAFREGSGGQKLIATVGELMKINTDAATLSGSYLQEANINMLGHTSLAGYPSIARQEWKPIGSDEKRFTGTYDGAGLTIEHLYMEKDTPGMGLFGVIGAGGTVKSIVIGASGFLENMGQNSGYICGQNYGTIEDCVNNAPITGVNRIGGICGNNADPGVVRGCINNGNVDGLPSGVLIAGVVGSNGGTVISCRNTGTVSGRQSVGGVVGSSGYIIKDCHNSGNVTASFNTGGVCGSTGGSRVGENNTVVTACTNSGLVTAVKDSNGNQSKDTGGVVGSNVACTVSACVNTGKVVGEAYVGGVVGYHYVKSVAGCYNTAEVSGQGYIGGVVGYIGSDPEDPTLLYGCYSTGTVADEYSGQYAGGVCGENYGVITSCYWLKRGTEKGISGQTPDAGEATAFSETDWPNSGLQGWGIGNDHATGKYWKNIGQWKAGGTPSGAASDFPKCWWE